MIKFGGPDAMLGRLPVSGNIGLRYVDTRDVSDGFLRYPTVPGLNATQCPRIAAVPGGLVGSAPIPGDPDFTPPPIPGAYYPSFCYLGPDDLSFATGGGSANTARNNTHEFLPSFNVRLDITPKWLVRFAASKAMSRPDIGLLKNFVALGMSLPNGTDLTDPRWVIGAGGQPVGSIRAIRPMPITHI